MEYPFTLYQDDDAKVVQLSGNYDVNWGCTLSEVKAVFYPAGQIRLYQLSNNDELKATEFSMNGQEVDAFFSAWETFKAELELKKLVEQKRVQDIVDSAQRMLADLPVFIEPHPESDGTIQHWTIRSPELESIKYTAYGANQLLERTKMAVADYERHQKEQAIHGQIKAIKESCRAITIRSSYPWHVCIDTPDIYGEYAHSPEELLERVKQAASTYDRWQAEEDLRIQERERLISEASALAESFPVTINDTRENFSYPWCVVMQEPVYLRQVYSPQELLDVVKDAKSRYEQHLIKIND